MVCSSLRILICILRSGITKLKNISNEMGTAERSFFIAMRSSLLEGQKTSQPVPRLMVRKTWGYVTWLKKTSERCWGPARNLQIFLYWDTLVGSEIRLGKQLSFLTYHISLFSRLMHPFGSAVTPGSSSPSFMMASFTETTSTKKTHEGRLQQQN